MTVGGMKRKVEEQIDDDDGMTELKMDSKRRKSSKNPEQTDGGPKSTTKTEPVCSNMIAKKWMISSVKTNCC